jgi:hypothetical protein
MMYSEIIKAKLDELPEDKEKEILDYIEFLLSKYGKKTDEEEIITVSENPIKSFRGKSKNKDIVKILLEERRKERERDE